MYGILQSLGIRMPADPYRVADSVFQALDENGDGIVTLDEYKDVAQRNPVILQGLGLFEPQNVVQYELPTSGVTVTFGHAHWGLMLNIMIGIRLSIPASAAATPKYLLPKHYTERQRIPLEGNFSLDVTLMDKLGFSTEKMEDNEFINYSPLIFQSAREVASIREESYMVSHSRQVLREDSNILLSYLWDQNSFLGTSFVES